MSLKYATKHRLSDQKGIVKAEYAPIVYAEFCWSRPARLAGLPAAPMQFLNFSRQLM
jgi:hypothetical protein